MTLNNGKADGTLMRRYVHADGDDTPILEFDAASNTLRQLLADHQGSIIATTQHGWNMIGINTYDEYGIDGAGNTGRFGYTGQAYIPELGMYYYKARMYSPRLGRFLQTDPIGYDDQINLYAYVANDPVNGADPSGTTTINCKTVVTPNKTAVTTCEAPENDEKIDYTINIKTITQSIEADSSISSTASTSTRDASWLGVAFFGADSYIKDQVAATLGIPASSITTVTARQSLMAEATDPRLRGVIDQLYRTRCRLHLA